MFTKNYGRVYCVLVAVQHGLKWRLVIIADIFVRKVGIDTLSIKKAGTRVCHRTSRYGEVEKEFP
jgi:hypothetical protein